VRVIAMYNNYLKRIFDFSAALSALIVLAPLMAIIAILLRGTIGSPVIFRQRRPGLGERLFDCLKFRTMSDARDSHDKLLSDAERLTSIGRFLRRSSLDELPQLWSILRGDMSFIGPRPLLEQYLAYYRPEERRRHSVRPGLTGWAQIHGRNSVPADERFAMDVWYVDHQTWQLDLHIFFTTIWIVIAQRGYLTDPVSALPDLRLTRTPIASSKD
jgi:sugar transferase EpsL